MSVTISDSVTASAASSTGKGYKVVSTCSTAAMISNAATTPNTIPSTVRM
jgi:hypothetical protein